jgi:glycine cleavage system H protein
MSDPLVFMMGNFEARFPLDRYYVKNHMWAQPDSSDSSDSRTFRFGFSAYAVRLLQDVYFLEWSIDEATNIREKQQIGSIESKKAESDLFAPMSGKLTRLNERLLQDPSGINTDMYTEGWLFEMEGEPRESLLSPADYLEHLASVWEVTQRTIKGQLNE